MLWTSIATGKRPFDHGIHGFSEPAPDGQSIRPITNLSRKTKAVWNILSQNDLRSNIIGWWPSHPAEPINGVMVSNQFAKTSPRCDQAKPLQPQAVHPPEFANSLEPLRVHAEELGAEQLLHFIPKADEIDQKKDPRLLRLARTVAEIASIHAAATHLVHAAPWDFMAVYFDGIDHLSHGFMKYHPPKLDWVSDKDFEIYQNIIQVGYMLHDSMLDVLLRMAGEDVTLLLISDHGFHPDHLRPSVISAEPAGPADEHRQHGIFIAHGPGIRAGQQIHGASLLDISPTILALFGLPVGEDMDGKALLSILETAPSLQRIKSWDDVAGDDGSHSGKTPLDANESRAALKQLVELGYIDKPSEDVEIAMAETQRELDYNLARSYMDASRHIEASAIFEKLIAEWPDEFRFSSYLIKCYQALGRIKDARQTLEELINKKQALRGSVKEELAAFRQKYDKQNLRDLPPKEQQRFKELTKKASINPYAVSYLLGSLAYAEKDFENALSHLKKAEKIDSTKPVLFVLIGDIYTALKQWEDAQRNYQKALQIEEENAAAHVGMAEMLLEKKDYFQAAAHAVRATQLRFHNPQAHLILGIALHRLNNINTSVEALELAVAQNNNLIAALKRLAYIYQKRIKDPEKADLYKQKIREARLRLKDQISGRSPRIKAIPPHQSVVPNMTGVDFPSASSYPEVEDREAIITIVSGLPRSGTSMMMQILEAGGIPALTDSQRKADEDNLNGYYELEAVKGLQKDQSVIKNGTGKCIKVVSQLLRELPSEFNYRIVFMNRNLDEVLLSQNKMLRRQGKPRSLLNDQQLKTTFQKQLYETKSWLQDQPNVHVISIDYDKVVEQPIATVDELRIFLGGDLDEGSMVAAVDPSLYRNRKANAHA